MKTSLVIKSLIIALGSLILGGCASSNGKYVQNEKGLVVGPEVGIQDFNSAASAVVNDLLASGALDDLKLKMPIKMLVSRVKSDVSEPINRELLTNQICMALNRSGKVRAMKDDLPTRQLLEAEARKLGKPISLPKITLTGSISQLNASNDDVKQITYVFAIEVNYRGTSIWMGQKQITKQFEKSSLGW